MNRLKRLTWIYLRTPKIFLHLKNEYAIGILRKVVPRQSLFSGLRFHGQLNAVSTGLCFMVQLCTHGHYWDLFLCPTPHSRYRALFLGQALCSLYRVLFLCPTHVLSLYGSLDKLYTVITQLSFNELSVPK